MYVHILRSLPVQNQDVTHKNGQSNQATGKVARMTRILSNREYSRLRYWRSFAWTVAGLCWMLAMGLLLMWNIERTTAMRLRSNLLYVVEMKTTWTGE